MHDADIIELSSEASSPPPQTAGTSIRRAMRNKGKGKMKEAEVIELTDDSDSESEILLVGGAFSKRHRGPPKTPAPAGPSKGQSKGRQQIVIDEDSDVEDIAAPGTCALAGPSRFKDSRVSKMLKEHLPSNGEIMIAGPSKNYFGGGSQRSADSAAESDTGVEVTQFADRLSGELNPAVGNGSMETNPQIPPHSPSPTASPARTVPEPFDAFILDPNSTSVAATTATTSSSKTLPPPVPLPPPPLLESPEETMSRYVAQVLEIVPDVDPEHCANLVADHQHLNEATVERILHILFEDPSYPRAKKGYGDDKGKRKADGSSNERPNKKTKGIETKKTGNKDDELWMNVERPFVGGIDYHDLALTTLQRNYPFVPKAYLRDRLSSHKGFYAPTFFFLRKLTRQLQSGELAREDYPYEPRKTAYRPTESKGKQRALQDGEFEREMMWVKKMVDIEERRAVADANSGAPDTNGNEGDDDDESEEDAEDGSDGEDEENGIECGCCFSKFRFEKMIQCPDAHLFCISCLRSYASTLLGSHNPNITCMSQSSCTAIFPASQLARVLQRKTYALYERLVQAKEIDAAGLEGLEECPFCEWKCVFDVGFEGEKLFRCGNDVGGCGVVSCRKCKKLDHLPKSCEEFESDKKLNARHLVEEAMTQALMRNCPKCKKAFIKESGCNKMTCPNCRTLSCYICRQVITGYEHFDQSRNPPTLSSSSKPKKCVLWDRDLDTFHANEVKLAADQAVAEARMLHPEVSVSDLKVDLPKAKPLNNIQGIHHPPMNPPLANVFVNMRRVAAHRRRRTPPPIPVLPPGLQLNGDGIHRAARRNNRNGVIAREVRVVPVQQQAPQIPHVHVHVHQPPQGQNHPQQQLHQNPYRAILRQQQPQFAPLVPPVQQVPVAPQPPYHQAVAQAMMGQYRPVGGGMEVGGRMLRARAGRVEAVANRPQIMGMANGAAALEPGIGLAQLHAEQWMKQLTQERVQHRREQQEQLLRQQQLVNQQRQLVQQQQRQHLEMQPEQQRQRERHRVRQARELEHERELLMPNLWAQAGNIGGIRGPFQQPEPEHQVVGQKRKRGHGG